MERGWMAMYMICSIRVGVKDGFVLRGNFFLTLAFKYFAGAPLVEPLHRSFGNKSHHKNRLYSFPEHA